MIPPRNLILPGDADVVRNFIMSGNPLSGYLAGRMHGGQAVQRLEEMWATKFGRRHAIAVNSATSGLLAACEAVGMQSAIRPIISVPALSMSATAAMPLYCGGELNFMDVDQYGCADIRDGFGDGSTNVPVSAAIITTLFGHPIDTRWQSDFKGHLIIDNAQGVGSGYYEWPTEQMGHIVVTSFNVHKQINAGELGIITTDDDELARRMRLFINHGENAGSGEEIVGLNLRPTEISALLAILQLGRIDDTLALLSNISQRLTGNMPKPFVPWPTAPDCYHAHYCYAFRVYPEKRRQIIEFLNAEGVPAIPMMAPLYRLPAFQRFDRPCDRAEELSADTIVLELTLHRYEDDIISVSRALERAAKL